MKKLLAILASFLVCASLSAETEIVPFKIDEGRYSIQLGTFDVYSPDHSDYTYFASINFAPSGQDNGVEMCTIVIVYYTGTGTEPVTYEFEGQTATLATRTDDDIFPGRFLKMLNPIVGEDGIYLVLSTKEDCDYFLGLLGRNNGQGELYISTQNGDSFLINLDFDFDEFTDMYLRCTASNRFKADYYSPDIDRVMYGMYKDMALSN